MVLFVGAVSAAVMVAVVAWWAVWAGRPKAEQVAKPLVMVGLIVIALLIDAEPPAARWLVIAGLMFGLVGDVMLLPAIDRFLFGLGMFLIGHWLYVVAFLTMDLALIGIVGGVAAAAALVVYLWWPVVRGVSGGPYQWPIVAYMATTVCVVVVATATHRWPIAIGGVLLATSNGLLGLDRVVRQAPQRRALVHMLYQLGQAGFVFGLAWLPL